MDIDLSELLQPNKSRVLSEHYGVTQEKFNELVGEAIKRLVIDETYNQTLDILFPELDAETRVRIHAYARASIAHYKINQ